MQSEESRMPLLASVFHELRNPVTLIGSYMQLLAARHPNVRSYPYWEKMETEMEHLKRLLADLSIWQSSALPRRAPLQPLEWFSAYLERIRAACPKNVSGIPSRKAPFFTLIADEPLPIVRADPDRLQMLMDNLIRNAWEAVGQSPLRIRIQLWEKQRELFILVEDNGPGIPPDRRLSVFEPFVSTKPDGTGLGLPICKEIAKAHGGSISYALPSGGGSGFLIRLPAEIHPESLPDAHNYPPPHL